MNFKPEEVLLVAQRHIALYERRIRHGQAGAKFSSNINVEECQRCLVIWKSIESKKGENLTAEEHREVYDAWMYGDYDHFFVESK